MKVKVENYWEMVIAWDRLERIYGLGVTEIALAGSLGREQSLLLESTDN